MNPVKWTIAILKLKPSRTLPIIILTGFVLTGRQGQVFNLDIAQFWNVLAMSRLINRESNMKARENLLLVSEKGILNFNNEPYPNVPFQGASVNAGDVCGDHVAVIVDKHEVWAFRIIGTVY